MATKANCITDDQSRKLILTVGDALYAIGGKWKIKVVIALFTGAKRFNSLQRSLQDISPRVLSNELKELEINDFVKRNIYASAKPVIIEYELTDYSYTLEKVMIALREWGTNHREKIRKSS